MSGHNLLDKRGLRGFASAAVLALAVLPACVSAQPVNRPPIVAKVESLQFPAWIDRAGVRGSIKAGWALYAGDRISTGNSGRIVVTVVGGARVQFGGNAIASFTDVDLANAMDGEEPSLFRLEAGRASIAADNVAEPERGTLFEIGEGIVANVLGGQVLASADGIEDQVGLIDGVVEVSGPKMRPGRMSRPETMMSVPRRGKAQPVSPMPPTQIARWLGDSEPREGAPTLSAGGVWDVSIGSGYNKTQLESMACNVQEKGYPAEIYPVREPGKQVWYRVVVRRFASQQDASAFIRTAKGLGSKTAWVLLPQT